MESQATREGQFVSLEDRVREELESVPNLRVLLGGHEIPTDESAPQMERFFDLESAILALYAGLELLTREVNNLSERFDDPNTPRLQ